MISYANEKRHNVASLKQVSDGRVQCLLRTNLHGEMEVLPPTDSLTERQTYPQMNKKPITLLIEP